MLSIDTNHALVGMLSPQEISLDGLDGPLEWTIYDEVCWFQLLGTNGFSHIHVS